MSSADLSRFSFVIGKWSAVMTTHPECYGDRAGKAAAEISCVWGAARQWIECRTRAPLPGGQEYEVLVVINTAKRPGASLQAYAVNVSGEGYLYLGRWSSGDDRIEFEGVLDAQGAHRQIVAYERLGGGGVGFNVRETRDRGDKYIPHSSAIWTAA